MFVVTDENGRVVASSTDSVCVGGTEVQAPDGFTPENQSEYRLDGGALMHDPLPPTQPAPDPLDALRAENALLKAQVQALSERGEFVEDCLAEMAMAVYQ